MWAQMVDPSGPFYTGTLWEKLGQNGQDTDSNASLAHGWSSAPVSAFSGYLLGIRPTGPGYRTWSIAPQPGRLAWAQGQVPTPSGAPVVSRWRVGPNTSSFELTMSAPDGTSGTVAIPELGASRTIAEDGRIVWSDGAPVGGVTASEADGAADGATITGSVTATGAVLVRVCGTTIIGPVTATGGSGIVVVGGDAATGPCAGNQITGTVKLTSNTAGVEFNGNNVTGSVTITGNTETLPPPDTGPVHATGNSITGPVNIQP